jgi:hypothetical protein
MRDDLKTARLGLKFPPPARMLAELEAVLASEYVEALLSDQVEGTSARTLLAATSRRVLTIPSSRRSAIEELPYDAIRGIATSPVRAGRSYVAIIPRNEAYRTTAGFNSDVEPFRAAVVAHLDSAPAVAGIGAELPDDFWIQFEACRVLVAPGQADGEKLKADVGVTAAGIQLEYQGRKKGTLFVPIDDIRGLSIDGIDQVRTRPRVGAVIAFGAMGLLAQKKERDSYIVLSTPSGDAVIEVNSLLPTELRARLGPIIQLFTSSSGEQRPSADDAIDRIARLAELHGKGALTDEEFGQAKAALLAQLEGS